MCTVLQAGVDARFHGAIPQCPTQMDREVSYRMEGLVGSDSCLSFPQQVFKVGNASHANKQKSGCKVFSKFIISIHQLYQKGKTSKQKCILFI